MVKNRGNTYRRVFELIKTSGGGLSAGEICSRLGLSSMAVRRQLEQLKLQELVFSHREKQRTGRPVQRYYLTEQGHESFERDYANLAIELLEGICSLDGSKKVSTLFRQRKEVQLRGWRKRVTGKSLKERVRQVTRLLEEEGYMARWEQLGAGRFLILEMNCAVAQAARRFPQVCQVEQELLEELLEARVTRERHIVQGDHYCSYVVEPRVSSMRSRSERSTKALDEEGDRR